MNLAFSTLGCPDWEWERILDEAQLMGYDGIEVRGIRDELDLPRALPFLPGEIDESEAGLARRGLTVCCLGSSCRFDDEQTLEANVAAGKAYIELAERLGAPFVRVFGDRIPAPERRARIVSQVVQGIRELASHAEGRGVGVILETHGDFTASEMVADVMRRVAHPAAGVLWDVHHPFRLKGEAVGDTFSRLAPHVRHVHVKDSRPEGGGYRYCRLGEGDVPLAEALAVLRGAGYDGWLVLEWEKRWHPDLEGPETVLPHDLRTLRSLLTR